MNNLAQAKQLSAKAEVYKSQGNHEYSVRCYVKIIQKLKQSCKIISKPLNSQTDLTKDLKIQSSTIIVIKPYESNHDKQKQDFKFNFPQQKQPSIYKNFSHQNIHIKQVEQNHKKPLFNKVQKKKQDMLEIDPAIKELIVKNIDIGFSDIIGMDNVKSIFEEAVIRPRQRPDLYEGIRAPPKGLLLYGPPGNGKTYIAKALAKQSNCTFFALSASSILNKFVGQSEKMIKKIFATAQKLAPSIIFIDEIDSILTARSQNQHEASRRLKTEFLVLMEGITSPKSGDILVVGATNLPQQLDQAAKRRFNKMIYIGMPEPDSRKQLVFSNLKNISYDLSESDIKKIIVKLEGYSASQIKSIIAEVSMIPLQELKGSIFETIKKTDIRSLKLKDFIKVIQDRKPIVSKENLVKYKEKI